MHTNCFPQSHIKLSFQQILYKFKSFAQIKIKFIFYRAKLFLSSICTLSCAKPDHSFRWVLHYFSHQRISQRVVRTSLESQLSPRGSIVSRGGSVPVSLWKHRATCKFPVWGSGPPVPHSWSALDYIDVAGTSDCSLLVIVSLLYMGCISNRQTLKMLFLWVFIQ